MGLITLTSFWAEREAIPGAKSQPVEWEEMLANHVFGKGLIPKPLVKRNTFC